MCPGNMEPAGIRLRSLLARPSRQPGRPKTWDCDRNPLRIPTSHHDARPTPTVNTRPGPTRTTRLQLRPTADVTTWPPRFGLCEPRTYHYHPPPLAVLRRGRQAQSSPPTRRQRDDGQPLAPLRRSARPITLLVHRRRSSSARLILHSHIHCRRSSSARPMDHGSPWYPSHSTASKSLRGLPHGHHHAECRVTCGPDVARLAGTPGDLPSAYTHPLPGPDGETISPLQQRPSDAPEVRTVRRLGYIVTPLIHKIAPRGQARSAFCPVGGLIRPLLHPRHRPPEHFTALQVVTSR